MKLKMLVLLFTVCCLSSCANKAKPLTAADIEAHKAMSQQFLDYVHAGNWEALSKMYEDDAVVMQMNTEVLTGPTEIHGFWSEFPPVKELRFYDDGIIGEGDLAYVYGRYWLQFDLPGNPVDEGKYLDVRRRQADGTWKYVAECANTSLPAVVNSQQETTHEDH